MGCLTMVAESLAVARALTTAPSIRAVTGCLTMVAESLAVARALTTAPSIRAVTGCLTMVAESLAVARALTTAPSIRAVKEYSISEAGSHAVEIKRTVTHFNTAATDDYVESFMTITV